MRVMVLHIQHWINYYNATKITASQGIALGGVFKSHHFGVAGHIAEQLQKMV